MKRARLRREDFNNDAVDAGDLGAGHSVTAIYEVTPVGSDAVLNDPLRYQAADVGGDAGELGFLKLRYKEPGQDVSKLLEVPISQGPVANSDAQFATAIAGFGQLVARLGLLGRLGLCSKRFIWQTPTAAKTSLATAHRPCN